MGPIIGHRRAMGPLPGHSRSPEKPNDPAVRQGRSETPRLGLEPRTYRLTAGRSTIELSRKLSVVGQGVRGHLAGDKARRLALSVKPRGRSRRRSMPRKCPRGPDWASRTGPTCGRPPRESGEIGRGLAAARPTPTLLARPDSLSVGLWAAERAHLTIHEGLP